MISRQISSWTLIIYDIFTPILKVKWNKLWDRSFKKNDIIILNLDTDMIINVTVISFSLSSHLFSSGPHNNWFIFIPNASRNVCSLRVYIWFSWHIENNILNIAFWVTTLLDLNYFWFNFIFYSKIFLFFFFFFATCENLFLYSSLQIII